MRGHVFRHAYNLRNLRRKLLKITEERKKERKKRKGEEEKDIYWFTGS